MVIGHHFIGVVLGNVFVYLCVYVYAYVCVVCECGYTCLYMYV